MVPESVRCEPERVYDVLPVIAIGDEADHGPYEITWEQEHVEGDLPDERGSEPVPFAKELVHECAEPVTAAQIVWPSCSVNRTHPIENFGANLRLVLLTDRPPLCGFGYCDSKAVFRL